MMPGSDPLQVAWMAASLAVATLVSEDFASIAAGVLVAEGSIPLGPAIFGCFTGILAGDLLLFAAGSVLGRRALQWPVLRGRVSPETLERTALWLQRRGPAAVLLTRVMPGTRVATYVAAGMLRVDGRRFALWLTLAAAVWTPFLVLVSARAGAAFARAGLTAAGEIALAIVAAYALWTVVLRLAHAPRSRTVKRRFHGAWRRATRWEFWPPWLVYAPVLAWIAVQMAKHRSVTLPTAVNPGIPGGGLVGESKFAILCALSDACGNVARAALLTGDRSPECRLRLAHRFIDQAGLSLPVVLKPDRGQRGAGVVIARTLAELASRIRAPGGDLIVQEYAPGHEFGVFYVRHPAWDVGKIVSLTEKRFPTVIGDGCRTLAELILDDERAVCLERLHRRVHRANLSTVPARGEGVQLVEIGSHCRGALFLDAGHLITPALSAAFDTIARGFPGFYFGRFDVRTPSIDDFSRGVNFKIVELNGLTSEPTHIYDPRHGVLTAWRVLCRQWRLAFEIAAENRRLGSEPTPASALLSLVLGYRKQVALDRSGGLTETREGVHS